MNTQSNLNSSLITDIQTKGLRLLNRDQEHVSRRGGAGPSDHQALTIDGTTVMIPGLYAVRLGVTLCSG